MKFNKTEYLDLVFEYYRIGEEKDYIKQAEFKKYFIDSTIYKKYFYGEKFGTEEAVARIKKAFEKVRKYDLNKLFLLGVSENRSEYMLPLIEKEIFLLSEKNNYRMQNRNEVEGDEIVDYIHSSVVYYKFACCGKNLYSYSNVLGIFEEFEEKEYREVSETDEKKFIELIKLLENKKNYETIVDDLYESNFFALKDKLKKMTEEEIKQIDGGMTNEEKKVFKGRSLGDLINAVSYIFTPDYKRCSNIVNGLWVLGIIRTKENITGTYDYNGMVEKARFGFGWFFSQKYIVDYETIKKYFGDYKLIKEFCDSREVKELEPEDEEEEWEYEEDSFDKIWNILEKIKEGREVNKDEAEKVFEETPDYEKDAIFKEVKKYIKRYKLNRIEFDSGSLWIGSDEVLKFFEEGLYGKN